MAVSQALTVLALSACGGANDVSTTDLQEGAVPLTSDMTDIKQAERVRWATLDQTAPVVAVGAQTEVSASGLVGLSGTVTDNMRLYRVSWSNSLGGSGTASLTGTMSPYPTVVMVTIVK